MINLAKVVVKSGRKAKQPPQPVIFTLSAPDVWSPKMADATLDQILISRKGKPSPQFSTFKTPKGTVDVWREKNKGFSARWFVKDSVTNKTFGGTKNEVRRDAGERIALMYHRDNR